MSATTNTELKDKLTLLFGGFGTELLELDRKYGDKVDAETEQEELKLNELYVAEVLKLVQAYCEQQNKPAIMPKHRRRSLTPQERSFEAEVASFVKAYPNMTLKEYWLGRWHQKSNLGAARLTNQEGRAE